jgi:DNA-binding response OmpR family regulator
VTTIPLVEVEPDRGRMVMRELEAASYSVRWAIDGPTALLRMFEEAEASHDRPG